MRLLPLTMLVACVTVSEPFTEEVDATGITVLRADVARGTFDARAEEGATAFRIDGTSTGRGSSKAAAAEHEAGNSWSVSTVGDALVLTARSESPRASVDMEVTGPTAVDLDVEVAEGAAFATALDGRHRIVAPQVVTTRLVGDVDIHATRLGMDVEIYPWLDGGITLTSDAGDVILRVPFGGDYDVEVWGDDQFEMFITDFGFVQSFAEPGYFQGVVGDGSIPVRVTVRGGAFEMLEAF